MKLYMHFLFCIGLVMSTNARAMHTEWEKHFEQQETVVPYEISPKLTNKKRALRRSMEDRIKGSERAAQKSSKKMAAAITMPTKKQLDKTLHNYINELLEDSE